MPLRDREVPQADALHARHVRRLRASLAALLGLPLAAGCTPKDTPPEDPVVVVSAPKPGPTMTVAAEPPPPKPVPAHSGTPIKDKGWIAENGAYCLSRPITKPKGEQDCGPHQKPLWDIAPQPNGMHGFSFNQAATEEERKNVADACCYRVIRPMRGRPLRSETAGRHEVTAPTEPRPWAEAFALTLDGLDAELRRQSAEVWAHDAALEHASSAEFSRIALSLLALGAPADLVRDALAAADDEVRHAQVGYAVASALFGEAVGPGPLPVGDLALSDDFARLAIETIDEGCIGECIASVELATAAGDCADPGLADALATMAEDEARHGELGWRILGWALETADPAAREAILAHIDGTVARLQDDPGTPEERPEAIGQLDATAHAEVRRAALRDAILPALKALRARHAS